MSDAAAADLLGRAKSGEREAFEQLIGPLIEPGYHIAFGIMRDRQEAEDAVQEAALTAWRKIGQLREESSARAWFFKIVVNRSRMQRRGPWHSVIRLPDLDVVGRWNEERTARTLDLRTAVRELAENDRLLLFLHYGLDLPLEEVAPVVGLSPAGTKTRLYRVLKRLRPVLAESEGSIPWK
ncbi:MAG: RNA polymerase sigma factor [Candidatus Dormibacter sp.]|uniref:RNA polymerase sigma factor n=1 Tax=Candidatus Dormibacter sp. TaxID=2973982 RepID=UPI0026A9DDCB